MPGAQPHPQSSWAKKENAHKSSGEAEIARHSLRNGFTAYSVLSLVSGRFSHHRLPIISANLIPASGDQDHTAWPDASRRTPCGPTRPSQPAPRVVAFAKRPSSEARAGFVKS